jgi:hypothetical protein
MNPRTWIKNTDYLEQEFQSLLRVYTKQRKKLLEVLEPLPPKDWTRTNTLMGAGKPLQQTLLSHADGLARHERAHFKQIERTCKRFRLLYERRMIIWQGENRHKKCKTVWSKAY